ncbi:hypothetical protein HanOQP8_Chr08g0302961 [Helianthus annuus]|nr:hypothetical protein HanIR_Chr08g0388271 [Helianthus annuus]KAJ0723825.1 hypothetical protein HanOQP8_Chr08g0302961 [Helianthus annuus]
MKEAGYAAELKKLEKFKDTRNEWFVKEEKKKWSRKATPKVQIEKGSSSQPQKKRQKKSVETMLIDESEEEDEAETEDEAEAKDEAIDEGNAEGDDVRLSPESDHLLKALKVSLKAEKAAAGDDDGDNSSSSSSSSSEEEIDETECAKRIIA